MESRKQRIQLLSRMNVGRATVQSFLQALSEALGQSIDAPALLSLEKTDALIKVFRTGYQQVAQQAVGYRRFFRARERDLVLRFTDCLAEGLPAERVFFLTKQSEYCGAVQLDLDVLLRHTASVLRFDGDSLSALSGDSSQGILIDHNSDDPEQTYELAVWGDGWTLAVQSCGRLLR